MIYFANFSDTYWSTGKGYMHPSTSISEALAVAERQHASGKDLILATVLAYEMQSRLADTFRWPGFEQHSAGGFAAAVAAGKLLGLNAEQMANAIGLGWAHSLIMTGQYGEGYTSNEKDLGEGAAAANGVLAALLAQKGFTGPVTIIESYQKDFEKMRRWRSFQKRKAKEKQFDVHIARRMARPGGRCVARKWYRLQL